MVAAGSIRRQDANVAIAQLLGAGAVALLASVPAVIFPESVEINLVEFTLACFIGIVGYAVARKSGASRRGSLLYGGWLLIAAQIVVVVKVVLSGH